MRHIILIFCLVLGISGPAIAQSDAIRSVISSQFDAFQADDFAEAFTFAAPNIQNLFQTPERFGAMVQSGYPMVHRPADIQYLGLQRDGAVQRQLVQVTDLAGGLHYLSYTMVETAAGWRIAAVQFVEGPGVGV